MFRSTLELRPNAFAALLVTATTGAAALALAVPAWASDKDKAESKESEVRIIKIETRASSDKDKDAMRDVVVTSCPGDASKIESETETKGKDKTEKTRVILCQRGAGKIDRAALISQLERARERIAKEAELSVEARGKALAALDEQIGRMRAEAGATTK